MKLKKRPIFLEITKNSFFAIILILTIYTVSQLVVFWIFIDKHEIDLVKSRYQEIINLSNSINIEFSEKGFIEYLERLDYNENDEYIRIYSPNELYYQSPSEVWQYINFDYANQNIHIKSKSFDFEIYKLITGPIQINNSEYTLQIVLENEMFGDFIDNSLPILIVSIILGLILSGIGAMYVSKKFIYKIRKLIETMNEIKANGLNKRAEISEVNDEIDKLNTVFNSMMDEIQHVFDEQTRFVSDASHELKTPLTALNGHLSMLKRWGKNDKERLEKSLDTCISEVERLTKIVNDMLTLSREEKVEIDLENINEVEPKIIIDEVIEQYKILNPDVNYITNIDDIKVKIDPNDLKQLLIIFIDNSIKYNNKNNIEIRINFKKISNKMQLEVIDNGIGIPSEEINNVMKRFYKVDKSRKHNSSFGIGLSIASRIVKNYNGEVFISSELDKYTKVTVVFKQ